MSLLLGDGVECNCPALLDVKIDVGDGEFSFVTLKPTTLTGWGGRGELDSSLISRFLPGVQRTRIQSRYTMGKALIIPPFRRNKI